tara:strand:- start:605 stop:1006 length:402 start_codon:yes stop_codon:yes gene_type:complete
MKYEKKNIKKINSLWWLPLFVGILIYIFLRPDDLIYNDLFSSPIKIKINTNSKVVNFLVYSLPNGLWSMSFSQLIFHIYKIRSLKTILLSSIMLFVGIMIELLQYQSFMNGTFDINDIFSYIISYLIILIIQK